MKVRLASSSVLITRVLLGVTFCWSTVPKIAEPGEFFTVVLDYGIIAPMPAFIIAVVVPWLELLLGLLLLGRFLLHGALLTAAAMLIAFGSLQLYALGSGLDISCGCFAVGDDAEPLSVWTATRAWALGLISLFGLVALRVLDSRPIPMVVER